MQALRSGIDIAWLVFWTGWLASALSAKRSLRGTGRRRLRLAGVSAVCVIVIVRLANGHSGVVHSPVLGVIGAALLLSGLMLAVWARVHLAANWGMPMTQRAEPELITSGPYRLVRHPIYAGLLIGVLGTALATDLIGLAIALVAAVYFRYAASVEERNLIATFPEQYPRYRGHTKMLVPFVY
ncbi:MAG: methyltransferase family protein [Solirubrobacteraceae bacterium]